MIKAMILDTFESLELHVGSKSDLPFGCQYQGAFMPTALAIALVLQGLRASARVRALAAGFQILQGPQEFPTP